MYQEDDPDFLLGTSDGRAQQSSGKRTMMPHVFDQQYYNRNELTLAQQEELDVILANNRKIGRGQVVPGNQVPRFPISAQYLMMSQSYDVVEQRFNPSKFHNKRASISNLPTTKVPGYGWDAYVLSDPYDDIRKFLFEDCFRSDPVVRRCLNLEADIALGERLISVMDIDEEFTADDIANGVRTKRLQQGLSDSEKSSLQTEFDFINKECKLRIKAKAAMIQARIGGRSVLEKIMPTGGDGIPTDLRILNWKKLGQIYINPKTWRIIAIEYADRPNDKPLLPKEIVSWTNDDWNITPDSEGYGLSAIEPVAAVSEINRLLDEVDFKEVAKTRWSPTGAAIFPQDTDRALIQAYMDSLTMGTMNGIDIPIQFQQFDLSGDLEALTSLRKENDQRIARVFGLPNPTIGFENITNRACYSEDTETLTENGWKHWYEIDPEEKIATFNPDNETIEYHVPDGLYVYDFQGQMVRFHTEKQDILVTPEHQMWHNTSGSRWIKRQARDFFNLDRASFRSTGEWILPRVEEEQQELELASVKTYSDVIQVQSIKMDTWLEFLGYYLSEGVRGFYRSQYITSVSQNIRSNYEKTLKIDKCIQSLKETGFKFYTNVDKDGTQRWTGWSKQLYHALEGTGGQHTTKCIPRWILNTCSKRQLQILFNSLMLGDGSVSKQPNSSHMYYSTTSEQLANDVQEIALKLGFYAKVNTRPDYRPLKNSRVYRSTLYRVEISRPTIHQVQRINPKTGHENIRQESYIGKVYCFHVKNHLFVTRRNGKTAIQGNTIDTVLRFYYESEIKDLRTWIQDTLEPQWFDPILKLLAPNLMDPTRTKFNDAGNPVQINDLDQAEKIRLAAIRDVTEDPEDPQAAAELSRLPILRQRQLARRNRKPRIKVKLEFQSISLEPLLEISQALMPMYQSQLITAREFLKRTNMPHLTEEVEIMQEEKKKQEEQQYKDSIDLQKQGIEVGRQRMMQSAANKSKSQNKVASISDQILYQYQYKNQESEQGLRFAREHHALRTEYEKKKIAYIDNLNRQHSEEMSKG